MDDSFLKRSLVITEGEKTQPTRPRCWRVAVTAVRLPVTGGNRRDRLARDRVSDVKDDLGERADGVITGVAEKGSQEKADGKTSEKPKNDEQIGDSPIQWEKERENLALAWT